jgi:MFS family permease
VTVALPAIGTDLHAGLAGLQWTVNAYTLTLSALLLLGGVLGDRVGRRQIFLVGVAGFGLASLACAAAPALPALVAARAVQGVGAALLTPASLAVLHASFAPADRSRAVGLWSGMSGLASAVGPFLGGWLVDVAGWRWVFLINLPLAALVGLLIARYVPASATAGPAPATAGPARTSRRQARRQVLARLDLPGAGLVGVCLGALSYALIRASDTGWGPATVTASAVAVAAGLGFALVERARPDALVPPWVLRDRAFRRINEVTVLVYAAFTGLTFLLVVVLQVGHQLSATRAGAVLLPTTGVMLLLSGWAGGLAGRIGPRAPIAVGSLVCAGASWWLSGITAATPYGVLLSASGLLGVGMALIVAPLTAAVLASLPDRHAGLAGALNTTVARVAGLLAVAGLPLVAGLSGSALADPTQLRAGFSVAARVCALLLVSGGLLCAAIPRERPPRVDPAVPRG